MIIESRANERVKKARKLLQRKERKESGQHLIEGEKLVREAISSGARVVSCFVEEGYAFSPPESAIAHIVNRSVLESLCESQTPQGVVAVVETPSLTPPAAYPSGLVVVLDGVQDPGNVGTVIRTANAFGIDAVVLTGACAELYAPKTVRATMGAIFRQRVFQVELGGLAAFLESRGLPLYGAALSPAAEDIRAVPVSAAAVAVGSEGKGLSAELLSVCAGQLIIPMQPDSESLNAAVAAAVIMWEMAR